jgi:HAD superfamily hydrolase (TIGR01509 family)
MRTPAAILIDMDGTLLDTEPLHFEAHRRFLPRHGIVPTEADLHGNIGRGDRSFYRDLMARHGKAGDATAWVEAKTDILVDIYRAAPVPLMPGADRLLAAAWELGVPVVVVTSSERRLAAAALLSAGLALRLPMRVTRDDVSDYKPHPRPFLLAAERLGLPPETCLAIEDSVTGTTAAAAAGCAAVAVAGYVPAAALAAAGARCVVGSLADLLPLDLHVRAG